MATWHFQLSWISSEIKSRTSHISVTNFRFFVGTCGVYRLHLSLFFFPCLAPWAWVVIAYFFCIWTTQTLFCSFFSPPNISLRPNPFANQSIIRINNINFSKQTFIHLVILPAYSYPGSREPVPPYTGWKAVIHSWVRQPVHCVARQIVRLTTMDNLEPPVHLVGICFECGRIPQHPGETYINMEKACKLYPPQKKVWG